MCKDKEHGGERCDSDTSDARRLRRKASSVLSASPKQVTVESTNAIPVLSESMTKLKDRAEELNKKLNNPTPKGVPEASWDRKNEARLTALGVALGKEADKIAGFDEKVLYAEISSASDKFYAKQHGILDKLENQYDIYAAEWDEVVTKHDLRTSTLYGSVSPLNLTDEHKALLNDDEKKLAEDMLALIERKNAERDKYREIDKAYDAYKENIYTEVNKKLALAYQEVLTQIRPLGGVAINSEVDKGDVEAQKIIAETVGQNYPTAWLEQHNKSDTSNFKINFNNDRPHYNPLSLSETEDDGVTKNLRNAVTLTSPDFETALKLKDAYTVDGTKTVIMEQKNYLGQKVYVLYSECNASELYSEETHGKLVNDKPTGEGWVKQVSPAQVVDISNHDFQNDDEVISFLQKKVWVKPITTTKKEVEELSIFSSETAKKINDRTGTYYDVVAATAYHEFGHRMEAVLPNNILPRQERAFLARRTQKTEDNWYENMVSTGMDSEYGHDAKLVSRYAGRDYFTDKNYEVFTVGIESLYGGAYGGLMGNSKDYLKTDTDHRGFVLGVLAAL